MQLITNHRLSILLAFGLAFTIQEATAQGVEFSKERFGNDKEGLRAAQQAIKAGDDVAGAEPPRYESALTYYLQAQKFNPENAVLNFKIGNAYLHSGTKAAALPYLQKAAKLNSKPSPRLTYLTARALHYSARWNEALELYQASKPLAETKEGTEEVTAEEIARHIEECKNGLELSKHPVRVFVDNAGPGLNSPASDYGPVISADESTILITSRRAGSTGGERDGDGFFEDIYQANWTGKTWSAARNLGAPVNANGHDATVGLAPDGQRMLVYAEDNGGDFEETTLVGNTWTKAKRLNSRINTKAHESSASYSPDGRTLYFVSDKKEGSMGERDIYKISLDGRNDAQNLGPTINTPYGEEGVFMQPDGRTMFFSSEGHNSMGGYDIFKSVLGADGKWSEPENLGWPINTPDDDIFFVTSASGRHGYYSSDRAGGLGGKDIYRITFLGPEKQPLLNQEDPMLASRAQPVKETVLAPPVALTSALVTILKGTVTDAATKAPLAATIDVIDDKTGQNIASFQSNAVSGRYLVSLPSGTNYGIVVRQDGYLFHSENFDLPATAAYAEVVKDVPLKKLEVGVVIVLNNIFFDTGKATLRPESTSELERLLKLFTDMPTLKLEMAGHTDNVGDDAKNQDLSQRRAQAVVTYLTQHGVAAGRLTAMGYGETKPVAPNTTKAGRQLNRRTEFKVMAK